jgi:hypothetical protein
MLIATLKFILWLNVAVLAASAALFFIVMRSEAKYKKQGEQNEQAN